MAQHNTKRDGASAATRGWIRGSVTAQALMASMQAFVDIAATMQTEEVVASSAGSNSAEDLAKQLANPIAALISVPF